MELPQPRPFGTEGRKPTHDFLSLYSHSAVHQDPRPSQGGYIKTHDFLGGKNSSKEENTVEITTVEKPPPPAPPPSVEHLLPGGFGTYSISHISSFNQRVPKPEGTVFTVAQASSTERNEDNSNCSSYTTGSGFTLWEESVVSKGKTGKENSVERSVVREAGVKIGQWTPERPSQSSSNNHRNSFSSLSSSKPSSSTIQKSRSFMDMIKSAKGSHDDDDDNDDDDFVLKSELACSSHNRDLTIKVDGKSTDQKANTPRSKHSATEQRRRSKINDRFQALRELIPHSDQKRDKASFLLEVIEYIQFLQEKVHKFEGSYQGWNNEPAKLSPWRNIYRPGESFVDQSRGLNSGSGPSFMFAAKSDENTKIPSSPTIPKSPHNPVESDTTTAATFKVTSDHSGLTNKAPMIPKSFSPIVIPPRLVSETEKIDSQSRPQLWHNSGACVSDCGEKSKEQELTIEGGTISISTEYSQGLLNTLTQALQSSGVDLSHASISVQIDLGRRANGKSTSPTSIIKDNEVAPRNHPTVRSRAVHGGEEPGQAPKRIKSSRS